MNSVLRFSIYSVLRSKIRSFGFLFIRSSGFGLPYQFAFRILPFHKDSIACFVKSGSSIHRHQIKTIAKCFFPPNPEKRVVVCYIKVLLWSITIIICGFILTPALSLLILCLFIYLFIGRESKRTHYYQMVEKVTGSYN